MRLMGNETRKSYFIPDLGSNMNRLSISVGVIKSGALHLRQVRPPVFVSGKQGGPCFNWNVRRSIDLDAPEIRPCTGASYGILNSFDFG